MPLYLSVYIPAWSKESVLANNGVRLGISLGSLPLLTSLRRAAKVVSSLAVTSNQAQYGTVSSQQLRLEIPPCDCSAPNRPYETVYDLLYSCANAGTTQQLHSPVSKFLGPCDFSLTHVVDALSTRLLVHILLLLLADKYVFWYLEYTALISYT